MICLKTFINKSKKDFESYSKYVEFVNENYLFAKTKSKANDFKGIVSKSELPSFHPYWSLRVRISKRNNYKDLLSNIQVIKKDFSKMKYIYNRNTSIEDLEKRAVKLKQEIYEY